MQDALNKLMDNETSNGEPAGIKQLLEKKAGLFRRNMMGKRVNFAARSVISPDPYINTNEIGVPLYFAVNLTYPEPVADYNVEWLRKLVINGPDTHPGALSVEDEDGYVQKLLPGPENKLKRIAIAKTLQKPSLDSEFGLRYDGVKKVYRHLVDGDFLLVNRQPTLHKPSIMSHKAKILGKEKTIHMHYANCSTYNADFDGDEMNLHFPQNELARAEAKEIALNDNQYVVPKDGSPLRGLIQDNVVSGIMLTCRDSFFNKQQFQQLIYWSIDSVYGVRKIVTPIPAIVKPVPLWTGKQVISTILEVVLQGKEPLNMEGKTIVAGSLWGPNSGEDKVIIRSNEVLTGVIGKSQYGSSKHGLVHSCHELYGPSVAGELLTIFCRLMIHHLQFVGMTCGLEDMIVAEEAERARLQVIENASGIGLGQAGIFTRTIEDTIDDSTSAGDITRIRSEQTDEAQSSADIINRKFEELMKKSNEREKWDSFMIGKVGHYYTQLVKSVLPNGQKKLFPKNRLALMTLSKAKGSQVNTAMITCLLGQQELEGRRVPMMDTGKTLPCFEPYDTSPRAGGFVMNRYLTGIQPPEYYFHCMAGREGLVDTAVKTSNSGYLQRCLVKHLEGLCVAYDYTVRDNDGCIIQFNYGEDGIDVSKTGFLENFEFFAKNTLAVENKYKIEKNIKKMDIVPRRVKSKVAKSVKKGKDPIDPIISNYPLGNYIGAVSEEFENKLKSFMINNSELFTKKSDATRFKNAMYFNYLNSAAQPGENVGTLAAQSIGEPSTQMTLNTFHLAGKGELNVTLGIPRLRELIMTTGGNMKTPSMNIPLKESMDQQSANRLAQQLVKIELDELVKQIHSSEKMQLVGKIPMRTYKVRIRFKKIPHSMRLSWDELCHRLEQIFLRELIRVISKLLDIKKPPSLGKADKNTHLDKVSASIASELNKKNRSRKTTEDDLGTAASLQRKKKNEGGQYGEASEEELELINRQISISESEESSEEHVIDPYEISDISDDADNHVSFDQDDEESQSYNEESIDIELEQEDEIHKKMLGRSALVKDYKFFKHAKEMQIFLEIPSTEKKLLIVSIIENLAKTTIIREIPHIEKCAALGPTGEDPRYKLQTLGINFPEIWKIKDVIAINEVYANDLKEIYIHYGIEAARNAIIREISGVFSAYGIGVNPRHLSLIADYMTHEGSLKPFNRIGINSNPSTFLKMSFETTMKFLTDASLYGDHEPMVSPSSQLVVGGPVEGGTGMFEVAFNLCHNG
eukprot:TRINITY_DN3562_c0_g1_i1.p1 TRINITY_DN3562_c0_g1~~TRINITY_DN3562_c0_g1_i1.p1  ORF type:complete len:1460 (-),score=409.83 TRINITY_DN3562_c0_g1_i1:93-3854(-)